MRQWIGSILVQIMANRLFGAKPVSKPMVDYCQLGTYKQTSVKFHQNTELFINKNASESIISEKAAISSRDSKINSAWLHEVIWRRKFLSTLTQIIFCDGLKAATWTYIELSIARVLGFKRNFTASAQVTILFNDFEKYNIQITATSPKIMD